jgi:hypothetical protein
MTAEIDGELFHPTYPRLISAQTAELHSPVGAILASLASAGA